jgi:hypothetical protein
VGRRRCTPRHASEALKGIGSCVVLVSSGAGLVSSQTRTGRDPFSRCLIHLHFLRSIVAAARDTRRMSHACARATGSDGGREAGRVRLLSLTLLFWGDRHKSSDTPVHNFLITPHSTHRAPPGTRRPSAAHKETMEREGGGGQQSAALSRRVGDGLHDNTCASLAVRLSVEL